MKILLLSDLNSIHTKKWVSALSDNGINLCVFGFSAPEDDFYAKLINTEIHFAAERQIGKSSSFSKLSYLNYFKTLKKVYKSFKPDLVHAHYASSYGLLGSFLRHKPFLISMWGTEIFDFPKSNKLNRFILKRNLKRADHLFSTSHAMAKEAELYTSKEIHIIPFGVNLDQFTPVKKHSSNEVVIGIVKTLEPNYGIRFLIDAFKQLTLDLPAQKMKLIIAGSGSEENALKEQVKSLNIESLVDFRGYIKNEMVAACFNEMDIAVVSSLEESFGVSAVEAAACEIPVVATRVGGLPEVVLDNITGLLCEPANVNDLKSKLEYLVLNPDLREKFGKDGRTFVLSKYDWQRNVQEMIKHYNSIYDSKSN